MYKLQLIIFLAVLIGGLASCKTDIDPNSDAATTLVNNKADITTYATSKGLSGTMTASGLYFVLNKPGSSTVVPAYGQELEFNYKLYVLNGPSSNTAATGVTDALVDSAYATTSVFYPFFAGSLRPGLQEGFLLMHEGDQATLLIPSALAFGNVVSPDGKVPANSPVRYDITLKRVRTEAQQIDDYIAANKLTVTQTSSTGLRFIKTTSVDTTANKLPTGTQTLTVKYTALLLRSTTAFESGTLSFTVGKFPITGVNEGLTKLRKGEKATLIFPSSLGYSTGGALNNSGNYVVPPNTPLRFDIELTAVN